MHEDLFYFSDQLNEQLEGEDEAYKAMEQKAKTRYLNEKIGDVRKKRKREENAALRIEN